MFNATLMTSGRVAAWLAEFPLGLKRRRFGESIAPTQERLNMSASKCWIGFVFLSLVSQPEWGQRIAFVDVTVVPMGSGSV